MRAGLTTVVVVALTGLPSVAAAKTWKGLTPGKSLRAEVEQKLGKPPKVSDNQGKCAQKLIYGGEQKPEGTKEAHICLDAGGKLLEISVFPDVDLDRGTVEEAYGDEYRKKLTDEFLTYWHYEREGLVVFFEKGGRTVKVLLFVEAKPNAKKPPVRDSKDKDKGGGSTEEGPD
ncbi:MAG: hypothetical protein HY904_18090 [Deltaproteobacteria bacterium]|nr:hypothetical protein [Deltaproteobacteria bacterium]